MASFLPCADLKDRKGVELKMQPDDPRILALRMLYSSVRFRSESESSVRRAHAFWKPSFHATRRAPVASYNMPHRNALRDAAQCLQ